MAKNAMSSQARLLARYLKEKGLATLSHTQALEALAHAMNFKSFNVAQAATKTAEPKQNAAKARVALDEAIALGMTVGGALDVFAKARSPEELAYLQHAQDSLAREGETEFDDNAVVSLSSYGGAYVMSWTWINASDLPLPKDPLEAFGRGYKRITFEAGDKSSTIDRDELELNDPAIAALREGKKLSAGEWLVRPKTDEDPESSPWPLTVQHLKALALDKGDEEGYRGQLKSEEELFLQFDV